MAGAHGLTWPHSRQPSCDGTAPLPIWTGHEPKMSSFFSFPHCEAYYAHPETNITDGTMSLAVHARTPLRIDLPQIDSLHGISTSRQEIDMISDKVLTVLGVHFLLYQHALALSDELALMGPAWTSSPAHDDGSLQVPLPLSFYRQGRGRQAPDRNRLSSQTEGTCRIVAGLAIRPDKLIKPRAYQPVYEPERGPAPSIPGSLTLPRQTDRGLVRITEPHRHIVLPNMHGSPTLIPAPLCPWVELAMLLPVTRLQT
ncbi:hypothetical protein B0I35DRAFT_190859 [Stachybotrys elegans]|uniref:Uncharacterized protein n=1 Tax=Stachybotrys elegans TaxID=80388 RepID=A0A8K0SS36_9HYPO|nr:hypothetical protein B0I35DRAFT_190859 [Stachybotrys elegans]